MSGVGKGYALEKPYRMIFSELSTERTSAEVRVK